MDALIHAMCITCIARVDGMDTLARWAWHAYPFSKAFPTSVATPSSPDHSIQMCEVRWVRVRVSTLSVTGCVGVNKFAHLGSGVSTVNLIRLFEEVTDLACKLAECLMHREPHTAASQCS